MMPMLKGKRYVLFVSAIVGTIAFAVYPIIIRPMVNPDYYKQFRRAYGVDSSKRRSIQMADDKNQVVKE